MHRVPGSVSEADITELFEHYCKVVPERVTPLVKKHTKNGDAGTCSVFFMTQQHADLAFDTLRGKVKNDSFGKPQKRVYLHTREEYIMVGKGKQATATTPAKGKRN